MLGLCKSSRRRILISGRTGGNGSRKYGVEYGIEYCVEYFRQSDPR